MSRHLKTRLSTALLLVLAACSGGGTSPQPEPAAATPRPQPAPVASVTVTPHRQPGAAADRAAFGRDPRRLRQ